VNNIPTAVFSTNTGTWAEELENYQSSFEKWTFVVVVY
jgi:hypothetical protein